MDINFRQADDRLMKLRCDYCSQIIIAHCTARCQHIFCEKCYLIIHLKPCPIGDCNNLRKDRNITNAARFKYSSAQNATEITWKIHNLKERLNYKNIKHIESEVFPTKFKNLNIHARLQYCLGHVSIDFRFELALPAEMPTFFHRRIFMLINQAQGEDCRDIVRIMEPGFGNGDANKWMHGFWGVWNFIPVELLYDSSYCINNVMIIKIILDPLINVCRSLDAPSDGLYLWKIENYEEKMEHNRSLTSNHFYSSEGGYRLRIELSLTKERGTNAKVISFFLWFKRGQWDDQLPDMFPHHTTITVFDQSQNVPNRDLSLTLKSSSTCLDLFQCFASEFEIKKRLCLSQQDGTLCIMVHIESLQHAI